MQRQIQYHANSFYNTTKNYKFLQPSSSLQLLLNSIQKNYSKSYSTYKVVYDDNKIPLQYHHFNYIPSQKDLEIYQWRNQPQSSIIKIQHVAFQTVKQGSKFFKESIVFTDHLLKTFKQLENIPLSGIFYLLKQSLIAFLQIKQTLGAVTIKKQYCGIDVVGRCKVWINSNFSKNQIEETENYIKSENDIVLKAVDIFKTMCNMENHLTQAFFNSIYKFLRNQKQLNVNNTIKFIEHFSSKNNISICNFISPLLFEISQIGLNKKKSNIQIKGNQVKKQKNCHVPQFLQKSNRRATLSNSLNNQDMKIYKSPNLVNNHNKSSLNQQNIQKLSSNQIIQLFKTPNKDFYEKEIKTSKQNINKVQRKNIDKDNLFLQKFNKSCKQIKEIKQKIIQQPDRRPTFFHLLNIKKQSKNSKKSINKTHNQSARQTSSAQNIFKGCQNYFRNFKNKKYQENKFTPYRNGIDCSLNLQQYEQKNNINSVKNYNLMSVGGSNVRKRNAYTPYVDHNGGSVSSARVFPILKKKKTSDLSACQIDNDIQISDFHTKRQNIKKTEKKFDKVSINQFNNGKSINIEGVQFVDECDNSSLICRQEVHLNKKQESFQSFNNKNNIQVHISNKISNQYNITVIFKNNDQKDKQKQKSQKSKKINKQSMTSTAQYTSFNSGNKKSPLNSFNWNNTSNSFQNDLSDFSVRMADSFLLTQNAQKQSQKKGTVSTLTCNATQNNFINKNTRSQKHLNIFKPSFTQSLIKNSQQQKDNLFSQEKPHNNFQQYNLISLSQSKNQNLYKKRNSFLPLSFQQIRNIATVESGFIKINDNQQNNFINQRKQCNLQKSNQVKNYGSNSKNSNNSTGSWLMNKKLQDLMQNSNNNAVSESICQGNDFGILKNGNVKGGDLQILSKMGRQIDSTIFSQQESI